MEMTFVLAYPCLFMERSIGAVVTEIEKLGLKIIEMRCMNVTEDFAEKHLENINKDIYTATSRFCSWVDYIASDPLVAMIVEGNNSVTKVLGSFKKEAPFWVFEDWMVYASGTEHQAEKDIKLWFRYVDSAKAMEGSKKAVYMLPEGLVHGPFTKVQDLLLEQDGSCKLKPNLIDNFDMGNMCVYLIKPLAFRERCVGEIIDAIEHSSSIKGLKLVKKAHHPSDAWPTDSDGGEYGVAVVAYKPCLNIPAGDIKTIDKENGVFEIGSDYLHQRKPSGNTKPLSLGDQLLEIASEFFDYGFSAWAHDYPALLGGCIFQASLVGIAEPEAEE